jgi:hypothetical protein
MTILSRLARAFPWRRIETPPERTADRPEGGVPAPLRAEDLRMMDNMDKYRSGLRHLAGSASIACVSVVATIGLFATGQLEAAFFAGFMATSAYWATAYARAAADELLTIYRSAYSRAEDMNRENLSLRKRLMWQAEQRRAEGEADGAGGTVPSASVRFLVPPKRVN